ncbi:MAG: hypothetical protein HBSIN02_20290 [Bacteroidia bacterium]|nr:MAG: hypothetical protein HBSIN02_20290 [Bacteroidia bacterium]
MRTVILFLFVLPTLAQAQEPQSVPAPFRLNVLSNPPGAEVYVDSLFAGKTPIRGFTAAGDGPHTVKTAYPEIRQWNAIIQSQQIHAREGEELTLEFEFGSVFSLHTVPAGASVYYQDKLIGTTPLYHRSAESLRSALRIRKEGYEDLSVDPSASGRFLTLKIADGAQPPVTDRGIESSAERAGTRLATYLSAGAMVVSGVTAAYFKQKADHRFGLYASTRSERHLKATRRYDAYSGVALVLTEISFAVLTYFLLSE